MHNVTFTQAAEYIHSGSIGVLPTDTLYGLVGNALDKDVVERVYATRGRDLDKPCIILIAHKEDVLQFGVEISAEAQKAIDVYWPGAVSIVFPCTNDTYSYLHRGKRSLAFRVPDPKHIELVSFLQVCGPVVAPSANMQGNDPATTIEQAKEYFGSGVDFYVDQGECVGEPSTVISLESGIVKVLREGAVKIQL